MGVCRRHDEQGLSWVIPSNSAPGFERVSAPGTLFAFEDQELHLVVKLVCLIIRQVVEQQGAWVDVVTHLGSPFYIRRPV